MDFREREIDFREADRRYAELKRRLDAESISDEEFDAQRRRLMVQDDEGRWWAKSRKTGEWHYRDGSTWVRDTPPGYGKVISEPTNSSAIRTSSPLYPKSAENRGNGRRRMPLRVLVAGLVGLALVGVVFVVWVLVPYLQGDDEVASGMAADTGEVPGGMMAASPDEDEGASGAAAASLPDVVGMSQEEAEEILQSARFEVKVETQESSEENKAVVMEQDPSGGSEVENNSTVVITVGEGPSPEEEAPKEEETPKPAPGYALVEDDTGALSVEVPIEWNDHIIGEDGTFTGEKAGRGEGIGPAITASTDVSTWENVGGVPGTYIVASRELARSHTEDQLVESGFNERSECEPISRQDFNRSPYSGKLQTWNCRQSGATFTTLAAAPEGRECVVMLHIAAYNEVDRVNAQHILDTFKADCRRIA